MFSVLKYLLDFRVVKSSLAWIQGSHIIAMKSEMKSLLAKATDYDQRDSYSLMTLSKILAFFSSSNYSS